MPPARPFSPFMLALRKVVVSALVIISFAAYTLHDREVSADSAAQAQLLITPAPTPFSGIFARQVVPAPSPPPPTVVVQGNYRDGIYAGKEADALYGLVQVQITVRGAQLTDVEFLDWPRDRRTSEEINATSMPYLKQEAIRAQSAHVDVISGATLTSRAFIQSLQDALTQAKN